MISGPRRLNWVTFVMLLGCAAGGYWCWKFLPHHYNAWQVDHVLQEAVARCYGVVHRHLPAGGVREVEQDARRNIVAIGIDDPNVVLHVQINRDKAYAVCDYTVIVRHPYKDKQSVLTMHRTAEADVKRANW
ncbi:MAG: hypothetical protein EXR72_26910 [Myxococcales bacterium]|nr:hypothetical protein [Myxococcales bacterium]